MTLPDYGNIIAYKQWCKEANDNEMAIDSFRQFMQANTKASFMKYPKNPAPRWLMILKGFNMAYESLSMVINLSRHDEDVVLDEMARTHDAANEMNIEAIKQNIDSFLGVFEHRLRAAV